MNGLSWFLYLIDIMSNIQGWFVMASGLIFILGAGFLVAGAIKVDVSTNYDGSARNPENLANGKRWRKTGIILLPLLLIPAFIASLIPSKETLYLIAGSQIGEQVIQLEQVQSIGGEIGGLAEDTIAVLREKLQEQIEPIAEATKE